MHKEVITMGADVNVRTFEDTMRLCEQDNLLKKRVEESISATRIIRSEDEIDVPDRNRYEQKAKVLVTGMSTVEAAFDYPVENHIAVLNSTWIRPGGRVDRGESGLEEDLCRYTTLKPCLDACVGEFYHPESKSQDPLFNNDLIYTPGVTVIKYDGDTPTLIPEEDRYGFDVISCIPPDTSSRAGNPDYYVNPRDLRTYSGVRFTVLHEKRLRRVLDVALMNGCDTVILCAFGCGRAKNPAHEVAVAASNVIGDYLHAFKNIEFAILDTYSKDAEREFEEALKEFID
jgi:uncharacterized protein (TIGR02452 family)